MRPSSTRVPAGRCAGRGTSCRPTPDCVRARRRRRIPRWEVVVACADQCRGRRALPAGADRDRGGGNRCYPGERRDDGMKHGLGPYRRAARARLSSEAEHLGSGREVEGRPVPSGALGLEMQPRDRPRHHSNRGDARSRGHHREEHDHVLPRGQLRGPVRRPQVFAGTRRQPQTSSVRPHQLPIHFAPILPSHAFEVVMPARLAAGSETQAC